MGNYDMYQLLLKAINVESDLRDILIEMTMYVKSNHLDDEQLVLATKLNKRICHLSTMMLSVVAVHELNTENVSSIKRKTPNIADETVTKRTRLSEDETSIQVDILNKPDSGEEEERDVEPNHFAFGAADCEMHDRIHIGETPMNEYDLDCSKRVPQKRKDPDFVYKSGSDIEEIEFDPCPQTKPATNGVSAQSTTSMVDSVGVNENQFAQLTKAIVDLTSIVKVQDERQREMTNHFNTITNKLRKIKVDLRYAQIPDATPNTFVLKCKNELPFQTYDELIKFEQTVDIDDFKNYLKYIGGKTLQRMLSNLVASVYSLDLQVATTWFGKRTPSGDWSKPPLCSTKTPHLIIDICQTTFPRNTLADVTAIFQKHMLHALDRQRKLVQKRALHESAHVEEWLTQPFKIEEDPLSDTN